MPSLTELRIGGALLLIAALAIAVHLLLAAKVAQGDAQCMARQAKQTIEFNARTAATNAAQDAKKAKAAQDAQATLVTVATAAGDALAELDGLRKRAAAYSGGRAVSCRDTAAAGSPAASAAADLQPDVLGRIGQAAAELAEYADRLDIAGATCRRTVEP